MQNIIQTLKNQQLIWHANSTRCANESRYQTSGIDELDKLLGGGFPQHGVVEMESALGIGELRLLANYLKQQQDLIVLIHPPAVLNAAFWRNMDFPLANCLVIHSVSTKEALWAAEQCLKSGVCRTVLLWQEEMEIHQVKRLQVASEQGGCVLFMFRPYQSHRLSLPLSLSLRLSPTDRGIHVELLKRRGGWGQGAVDIDYHSQYPQLTLASQIPNHTVILFPVAMQG
ncbi:translesion DNA synthesis-associated protein ImuA [Vibrio vulnificus]|nr:translesion DNA synthesis-associated protein ImuA [Vibrio vulnificus]ELV8736781.1 translesion DNA synthesis-associated protein ImuA [Vibrio vulnificus]MCU8299858.1 translesion DNA synthesis-associated protein ImuA [Vibrio vulnificus]HAS8196200.1 translesion DNA synthesis-associated protein ImuA [Vibrio vulnificus]HAS8366739.1 translesion DNA synthesis-associated protein ImuA [Vibrio vulnificus]